MEELFDEIQAFLFEQMSEEEQEQMYQALLEAFYNTPSYVERFKRAFEQEA